MINTTTLSQTEICKTITRWLAEQFDIHQKDGSAVPDLSKNLSIMMAYQFHANIDSNGNQTILPKAESLLRVNLGENVSVNPYLLFKEIRDFDKNTKNHALERNLLYLQLDMLCYELSSHIDSLGFDISKLIFQGYGINKPLGIEKIVEIAEKNNLSLFAK